MLDDAVKYEDTYVGIRRNGHTYLRAKPFAEAAGFDPLVRTKIDAGMVQPDHWSEFEDELFVTTQGAKTLVSDQRDLTSWLDKVESGELPAEPATHVWDDDSAPGQLMALFRDHNVRVVDEDMIVLSDVADALGYEYTRNVDRAISDRYKGRRDVTTVDRGEQEMKVAHRKGVIEASFRLSPRDPEKTVIVRAFCKWALDVLDEVLRTGSYQSEQNPLAEKVDRLAQEVQRLQKQVHADTGEQTTEQEQHDWSSLRQVLDNWIKAAVKRGYESHDSAAWVSLYNHLQEAYGIDAARLKDQTGSPSKIRALNRQQMFTACEAAQDLWQQ